MINFNNGSKVTPYPVNDIIDTNSDKGYTFDHVTGVLSPLKTKASVHSKELLATQYPHYYKDVSHLSHIDVYDVLKLFEVTDPCLQHAIKKLLALGSRGHKDHDKDFKDVIDSLNRYEIMRGEYGKDEE